MAQLVPDIKTLFYPLATYRDAIKGKLSGHVIMSKSEYVAYMKPSTTFLNLYTLIDKTKDICAGLPKYAEYCLTCFFISKKDNPDYNALFLVDSYQEDKDKATVGFVIVEKGECKTNPNMISIQLICSGVRGGGQVLIGAIAYCIMASEFEKAIILDLAGGRNNTRALTSYERFGFVDSETLRESGNCYPNGRGNLIMLLDLKNDLPEYIVQKVQSLKRELNKPVNQEENRNGPSKRRAVQGGGKRKTRKRRTKRKN